MTIEDCATTRAPNPAPQGPSNVLEQFSLKDYVCVVTGASGGIGSAIATAYAEAGAHVALWYNSNAAPAESLAATLSSTHGIRASAFRVDVSSAAAVQQAVSDVVSQFGRLDVFVANAGKPNSKTLLDMSLEEIKDLNEVNVDSVVYCAKFAGEVFRRQGKGNLIITSSISAHIVNVPVDQPVSLAPFDPYSLFLYALLSFSWPCVCIYMCVCDGEANNSARVDLQRRQSLHPAPGTLLGPRMARLRPRQHRIARLLQHGHGRVRPRQERGASHGCAGSPGRDEGDQGHLLVLGERGE